MKVETLLLQIGHKKRKDVSSPIMQVSRMPYVFFPFIFPICVFFFLTLKIIKHMVLL